MLQLEGVVLFVISGRLRSGGGGLLGRSRPCAFALAGVEVVTPTFTLGVCEDDGLTAVIHDRCWVRRGDELIILCHEFIIIGGYGILTLTVEINGVLCAGELTYDLGMYGGVFLPLRAKEVV